MENEKKPIENLEKPQEKEGELLEFLKRGEVRTMQKDISKIRKEEAQQEKEKIEAIRPPNTTFSPSFPVASPVAKPTEPAALAPTPEKPITIILPEKPKTSSKFFVRAFVMLVFFIILATGAFFGYRFFFSQVKFTFPSIRKTPQAPTQTVAQTPSATPVAPAIPAPQIPAAAFPMPHAKTLETTQNLPALFANFIQQNQNIGFTHIALEDTQNKTFLNAQDFFAAIGITPLQTIAANLQTNFTLFVYASPIPTQQIRERPGFILSLATAQGTMNAMRLWEPTLEKDTILFFGAIPDKKDTSYVTFFRPILYQNRLIRCQTFSRQDLGICYSIVDTNLIIASSIESMKLIINQLASIK